MESTEAAPFRAAEPALQPIAKAIHGFNRAEAAARTAVLLRLLRDIERPVPLEELVAESGSLSQTLAILRMLVSQAERTDAAFRVERSAEGDLYTLRPLA